MICAALIKPVAADHLPPYIQPMVNYEKEIFAPHVDVTRAKVGFGRWAIPKLVKIQVLKIFYLYFIICIVVV